MVLFRDVSVNQPEDSNFDWNDFYIRALMALEEPMIAAIPNSKY